MAVLVRPANKPRWGRAVRLGGDWTTLLSGAPYKTAMLHRLAFTIQVQEDLIFLSLVFWRCPFPILSPILSSFRAVYYETSNIHCYNVTENLFGSLSPVCQVVCFQVGLAFAINYNLPRLLGFPETGILASGPAYLPFHKNTTTIL